MGKRKSIYPRKKKKRSTVKKVTGGYTVDLPVEMITMLFKHMLRVDQGLLATCLGVCKLWKAIGTPILYKNIYVVDYHHYFFFRSIANDANGISRHVKSLTLHTYDTFGWYTGHSYFMKAIHIDIPAPSEGFPTCTGMFDLLPAMETLSIVCDERTEMPCLEAMLKLVPYTIRSFELNWPSLSPAYHRVRRPTCKDGFHVCHLLRNILPTVKHFQVRGLAICDSIVPDRNDFDGKMKCESINIILLHDMYTHTEHRAHKIASRLSKLLNTEESAPDNLKAATVTSLLAKAIMLDEACDSHMAHCDWSAIILRNLVQKLTTTIPIEGAFSIDKFSREVNDRGSAHFMRQPDVTVERGFKDVFAINFEELIQGVVPDYWTEDSDLQVRLPITSLKSPWGKAASSIWIHASPAAAKISDRLSHSQMQARLWKQETSAGRPLLKPEVHKGLAEIKHVRREKCQEELDGAFENFGWVADLVTWIEEEVGHKFYGANIEHYENEVDLRMQGEIRTIPYRLHPTPHEVTEDDGWY